VRIAKKTSPLDLTEWSIVGQLPVPGLAANLHHFHDWATALLAGTGYNVEAKGVPGQRCFATVLPSGKELMPGDSVLISNYSMGRMDGV
jgi:hypothetical protein